MQKQIYLHQKPDDICIFNYDDPITLSMSKEHRSRVYYFSARRRVERGTYLDGDELFFVDEAGTVPIIKKQDID